MIPYPMPTKLHVSSEFRDTNVFKVEALIKLTWETVSIKNCKWCCVNEEFFNSMVGDSVWLMLRIDLVLRT